MIEFYPTMRVTGSCPGIRCNEGWLRAGYIRDSVLIPLPAPAVVS